MFLSSWSALGWAFLLYIAVTLALPALLSLVWLAYIRLTPAGRAWNAWYGRELARLKTPRPRQQVVRRRRQPLRRAGSRIHGSIEEQAWRR